MAIEGVDYAGSRPAPAGLYAAGKRFVVRYGGPGGAWKHIDAAEARALTAAGLSLVANAEGAADGLRGRQAGIDWARSADAHFRGLGMPADRPIYLSADWDVQSGQWPAVRDALRGAASVLGIRRVGVYGSYDVMQWARRDAVARWFWQTYAWSAGKWAGHNHIEQYRNGVTVAGGDVDLCRALTADYGQWGQRIEEDDVSAEEVWAYRFGSAGMGVAPRPAADWMKDAYALKTGLAALRADVAAALGRDPVDEEQIVQGVLAGLGAKDPEAIAAALRAVMSPEQARAVGELLTQG